MADAYSETARDNILRLSHGTVFPDVFKEWRVTGEVKDYVDRVAQCQLCEQERLRFHFEIENRPSARTLWVGSSCIIRFGVPVFEGTRQLSGRQVERKLASLLEGARQKTCLAALRALARKERNEILDTAIRYFEDHGNLSPKLAFVVLWRLRTHSIDHNPALFKINLRRQKYVRDLEAMSSERAHLLWPALSPAQRSKVMAMGHPPPKPTA